MRVNRMLRVLTSAGAIVAALLLYSPAGTAQGAFAGPVGDVVAIGEANAPAQVDLYLDPMCPYSGQMIRAQGDEIGKRIESGKLRINLRLVGFLDKYSASGSYDSRAIYAVFVIASQSQSSEVTWRFIQQIFSAEHQPQEGGTSDLDNNQLAELAGAAGAPQAAQDLIRFFLPIGYNANVIAANNLSALHQFPEPGVPTVVIDGQPVDGESDWLSRLG